MDTTDYYAVASVIAFKDTTARWKTEHVHKVVAQGDGLERLATSEVSPCSLIVR